MPCTSVAVPGSLSKEIPADLNVLVTCFSAFVSTLGGTSFAASHRGSVWEVMGSPIPNISDCHGPPVLAVRDIIIASADG